jgi:hypothetical protein
VTRHSAVSSGFDPVFQRENVFLFSGSNRKNIAILVVVPCSSFSELADCCVSQNESIDRFGLPRTRLPFCLPADMKIFSFLLVVLGVAGFTTTSVAQMDDVAKQNALFEFIQKASEITLYSLDPVPVEEQPASKEKGKEKDKPSGEILQGYRVLGKIAGTPNEVREQIRTILMSAMASPEETYECFAPRIGVTLIQQGRRIDLLLCYQCHQCRLYFDGQWDDSPLGTSGESQFNAMFDQREIKRDIPKPRPAPAQP